MSYILIVKKNAQLDIDEAVIWYEEQKIGLGIELIFDFDKTIIKILRNPFYASFIYKDARAASLKSFPYEIIYRVYEFEKRINVLGFNHQHRKPLWFKDR